MIRVARSVVVICRVAIPDNQCTVCSAKCPWSFHKKTPFRMRIVKEGKTKINESMKRRYVSAETDYRENKVYYDGQIRICLRR